MNHPINLALSLGFFLLFQIAAVLCFKWGSSPVGHYAWSVVLGNAAMVISSFFLVDIYKRLPPAEAMAFSSGGAFLCCQLALLLVFRQGINPAGWCALALILSGIMLFAFTGGG